MKLTAHTGPVIVREIADALRAAGISVLCEGTEHVYVEAPGEDRYRAAHGVTEALRRTHGKTFGLVYWAT